jgi:hypothetical protein
VLVDLRPVHPDATPIGVTGRYPEAASQIEFRSARNTLETREVLTATVMQ